MSDTLVDLGDSSPREGSPPPKPKDPFDLDSLSSSDTKAATKGDLDDFDPLGKPSTKSSTTTSSRTSSVSESTTSESSSAITDKSSKKETDDLKDLLGGSPASKEEVTDIFAKDRGSPDSVKELPAAAKKTESSKVVSRASSSGVGSVSTRSRSSSSSSSSSEEEAETKKKPEPEAKKPEPETKKAEPEKKMSEMNGPQVKREKLPDGGEKITTTRQEKQPDGTIKTFTESKTVYPEVQTGSTTTKQAQQQQQVSRQGAPAGPGGVGEPDEVSSNDEGSNLNDSFTEGSSYSPRSSGGLHSPRSPGGTRLEDQLPAFVPPKRYVKPEEKKDTKAPGVMIMGAGDAMCKVCGKRVYEMEKVLADKNVYHKMCFKCYHCKRVLSLTNFASMEGNLYCKPHFMELFKTKGLVTLYWSVCNYEEGFGKERHVRQWTPVDDGPAHSSDRDDDFEANLRGSGDVEDGGHHEVLREEDKLDDGIESVPSIRNLKSRFESKDAAPPPLPADRSTGNRSRSPYGGGRVSSGDEEQVGYVSYTRTSNSDYFDNTDNSDDVVPRSRVSKWDKPKEAPPPPVNREVTEEEILAAELPAVGTSRSIAERFRQYEGDGPPPERKPIRKITPPREELAQSIAESEGHVAYDRDVVRSGESYSQEEELPPAEYTRSMLAKFRNIEDTSAPVPSPMRSAQVSGAARRSPGAVQQHHRQPINRPSPDSGISDTESQNVNGDAVDGGVSENNPVVLPDVVRESDRHDEEELPETGTTRSLLAQWRNMEQTVQNQGVTSTDHLRPKSQTRNWNTNTSKHAPAPAASYTQQQHRDHVDSAYGDDDHDREIIRAGDYNPEDELPPPSTTRNMLAKFQEIQEEAQREAANLKTPPPSKKQFKWTVKEARPLFKGRRDSGSAAADTNGYHDVSSDSIDHHMENGEVTYQQQQQHHHSYSDHDADSADDQVWRHNEDIVRADEHVEEELPAPQTTRSMLAVFQSMEDVNRPPPTPEYAKQVVKQASPVRTYSIRRGASPPPSNTRSSHYSNHLNGHQGDGYHSDDEEEHAQGGDYNSSSSHDELYRDYDQHGGEFENEPYRNPDVVREDTTHEEEELPEQGTTKNLLAKFQALQAI